MERNGGIMAVYRRHDYLRRNRIKEKSRDGGNHHDSKQKQLKEIITHEKRNGNIKANKCY